MAKQGESRLQRKIRKALEKEFGGYWWKVWGGPFQPAGLPDLMGIVDGRAICLEVKRPKERASLVQERTMARLSVAGAIVAVVTSVAEAIDVVNHGLYSN